MQKYIVTVLLCTLLGSAIEARGAAIYAQPEVNNRPTQGPIVERHGGLSGVANAMADEHSDAPSGLTQIGTGVHSLVGEIGRMPLASVLAGIVPDNFRVLLDDPNLLLGVQVSWRNQQPLNEVLTEVAVEYGIDFTLDWTQRALLVSQRDFNTRPASASTQRPRLITGPLVTPNGSRRGPTLGSTLRPNQVTGSWSAPTSIFIPFALGSAIRVVEPSLMPTATAAALEAAAMGLPINVTGISHATDGSTPRKRLVGYAEQRAQWVADRLVAAGVDRHRLHLSTSVAREANTLRAGVQLRATTGSMVPVAEVAYHRIVTTAPTIKPTIDSSTDDTLESIDAKKITKNSTRVGLSVALTGVSSATDLGSADGYRSAESRVSEALRLADRTAGVIDTDSFDLQALPPDIPRSSANRQHPYCGRIDMIEGSLRLNIDTNISRCGYAIGRWHFYSGNQVVDWLIDQPISASSASDIDGVLGYFQNQYNLLWQLRGRRVDFAEYRRDL